MLPHNPEPMSRAKTNGNAIANNAAQIILRWTSGSGMRIGGSGSSGGSPPSRRCSAPSTRAVARGIVTSADIIR